MHAQIAELPTLRTVRRGSRTDWDTPAWVRDAERALAWERLDRDGDPWPAARELTRDAAAGAWEDHSPDELTRDRMARCARAIATTGAGGDLDAACAYWKAMTAVVYHAWPGGNMNTRNQLDLLARDLCHVAIAHAAVDTDALLDAALKTGGLFETYTVTSGSQTMTAAHALRAGNPKLTLCGRRQGAQWWTHTDGQLPVECAACRRSQLTALTAAEQPEATRVAVMPAARQDLNVWFETNEPGAYAAVAEHARVLLTRRTAGMLADRAGADTRAAWTGTPGAKPTKRELQRALTAAHAAADPLGAFTAALDPAH